MAEEHHEVGSIGSVDLTIEDAEEVRDFYRAFVGWTASNVNMGEYDDFCMNTPAGLGVAGVCHARGENADLPPQWLVHLTVAILDESLRECTERGGKALTAIRSMAGTDGRVRWTRSSWATHRRSSWSDASACRACSRAGAWAPPLSSTRREPAPPNPPRPLREPLAHRNRTASWAISREAAA